MRKKELLKIIDNILTIKSNHQFQYQLGDQIGDQLGGADKIYTKNEADALVLSAMQQIMILYQKSLIEKNRLKNEIQKINDSIK
jgi:hypothetical protein